MFLQKTNKESYGDHGNDECNCIADGQLFYFIGRKTAEVFIVFVKFISCGRQHRWHRKKKGKLCSSTSCQLLLHTTDDGRGTSANARYHCNTLPNADHEC